MAEDNREKPGKEKPDPQLQQLAELVAEILSKGKASRVDKVVDAQMKSIENMAEYGKTAAGFLSKGNFNLGEWAELYANTVKSVSENMLELTRAILK